MTKRNGGAVAGEEALAGGEDGEGEALGAALIMEAAEEEAGVIVQGIALEFIEPDPSQVRRVFDEDRLQSLAASIRKYGLLQEPGVSPVSSPGEVPERFRIVWGERRWRAARIAGLTHLRCKVIPRGNGTAAEKLRLKEKQWAENAEREGLSPIEEAIAIQEAVEVERQVSPDAPIGTLVEKVGAQRGFSGMVSRNLVALLKTPQCLQTAIMGRSIGREVGVELMRYWNRLIDLELHGSLKREVQYRNLVASWAVARGLELSADAMNKYAAETFQDPKVVKATCRKVEEFQRAAHERFKAVVERAQKQKWTVVKARAALAVKTESDGETEETVRPLFEQTGKARPRLTIYLDRLRDPALATPHARAELVTTLHGLIPELGAVPAAVVAAGRIPDRCERNRPGAEVTGSAEPE